MLVVPLGLFPLAFSGICGHWVIVQAGVLVTSLEPPSASVLALVARVTEAEAHRQRWVHGGARVHALTAGA